MHIEFLSVFFHLQRFHCPWKEVGTTCRIAAQVYRFLFMLTVNTKKYLLEVDYRFGLIQIFCRKIVQSSHQ